jgi:hypothetical protein
MSKFAFESPRDHAGALIEMARTVHRSFVALDKSNQYGRFV